MHWAACPGCCVGNEFKAKGSCAETHAHTCTHSKCGHTCTWTQPRACTYIHTPPCAHTVHTLQHSPSTANITPRCFAHMLTAPWCPLGCSGSAAVPPPIPQRSAVQTPCSWDLCSLVRARHGARTARCRTAWCLHSSVNKQVHAQPDAAQHGAQRGANAPFCAQHSACRAHCRAAWCTYSRCTHSTGCPQHGAEPRACTA